jgi:glycerol uptake facilitator-like aquaporin
MSIYDAQVYPHTIPGLNMKYWVAYIFGPLIGGMLAGIWSRYVHEAALDLAK